MRRGLVGCDTRSIDDPDAFGVRFANDLSIPVVRALCRSDHTSRCEHPYYRDRIVPGDATSENISPDVLTEWAVESEDEEPLRCVVLYWKHWPGHDMQVEISHAPRWAWPCPRGTPATPVH